MNLSSLISKIKKSDIGRRIASGAFWSIVGTAMSKILVLIGGMLCARILGKEGFGEFGMIRSTITMFVVFGTVGLGLTATKHISEYRKTAKDRIPSIYLLTNGFAVISGLIITILVLLFSNYLATSSLNSPQLLLPLRLGALLLFVTVLNGAQKGTLSGFECFRGIAKNNVIGGVFETVFMLMGAYFYNVEGAILGYGMGYIALYVANHYSIKNIFTKHDIKISWRQFDKSDLSLLYKFSLPAMLSSVLVTPVMWVARTLLVNNGGFEELAIYEVATQWRVIILFIPSSIVHIVLPILSSINVEDHNKFWKVLKYNIFLNAGLSFLVTLLVCIFSPLIMKLYGRGFTDPYPLIVLSLSTIFSSISSVVGASIQSRSKIWAGFSFNLIWAIIVLGLSYYFVTNGYGAVGLSMAILISYFIHSINELIYLRLQIKKSDRA